MTISGDTICGVIQAFPVLLIIAQNSNRCLKTPLVYTPPSPTRSPEFYEAYDALLQSLFGHDHGCHGGHEYGHTYGHQYVYQHGENYKSYPEIYAQQPCHGYGYGYPGYPTIHTQTHHGYPNYGYNYKIPTNSYPTYKKVYNISLGNKGYAPGNQVYGTNHKYKIVVKHNRIGKRPHSLKLKAGFQNQDQRDRYANQNQQTIFSFIPNTVRRLSGILHFNQDNSQPKSNGVAFPMANTPANPWPQDDQRTNNNDFNQYPPTNIGLTHIQNQNNNNEFMNFNYPRRFEDNGNAEDHHVFPNNQKGDEETQNPNIEDKPPMFSDDYNGKGNLQEKNGPIDEPQVPTDLLATTSLPALTPVPVSSEGRSGINFANFQETCETVDGNTGSCIAITLCPEYKALLKTARSNPTAVQLLRKAHCGFEGSSPKVCCPRAGIPSAPPTISPITTTSTARPEPVRMPDDQQYNVFLEPPVCGFSNASFGRVVGGDDAKLADFPWMALLGYKDRRSDTPNWLCGGSLITAGHVLTAAHCVNGHENDLYLVRLGELDLARDDEGATPIDVPIRQKIKHEEYNPKAFTNDIAILVLDRQVAFTDLIRPICMPKESELRARNFVDYKPIIAGWGDTEFRGPSASHLQALQLPVVSNEFCANAYKNYKAQKIDERVLCAGFKKGGKDACQGDSGGPLMQPIWNSVTRKTYFYQIGVVSFGRKCAEAGFPGVYSRVTAFIPWIEQTLRGSWSN